MLSSFFVSFLALATTALARPAANHTVPAFPPASYLFTVNITSGESIELGETPAGQRTFQPVAGGTFSGPEVHGELFCRRVDCQSLDQQDF